MAEKEALEKTITIQLKDGSIVAAHEGDLVRVEGLKHSEQRRFTPPSRILPWTEPIDCTKPGPLSPQLPFEFEPLGDMIKLDRPTDENCLTVNVVAPADAREKGPIPVLVWIHGGAYVAGTGDLSLYDTRGIARRGLVVVSVQYRLGIFGYARIPGVSPANLGLMDQIAGLKWVQENVAAFGGDPQQVTIFGQSAGGDAIYSLLLAEGTEGLFHRAVLMSSPFGLFQHKSRKPVVFGETVKRDGKNLATASTEEITKIGEKILEDMKKKGLRAPGFYLEAGQAPLPPTKDIAARLKDRASKIPIMIGWTKHDVLPFLMIIPILSPLTHIPVVGKAALLGLSRIFTHLIYVKGSKALHRQYTKDGGKSVTFSVEWYPKGSQFRASHCMETPLLFGGYEEWVKTPILKGADKDVYERLSMQMKNLLVTFVEGGSAAADELVVREDYKYIDGEK